MSKNNQPRRGDADIFMVNVQFRQNATWQGTIKLAGHDEEQRFRSTLEMLKIMDGALAVRHPEDLEEQADEGDIHFAQPEDMKTNR